MSSHQLLSLASETLTSSSLSVARTATSGSTATTTTTTTIEGGGTTGEDLTLVYLPSPSPLLLSSSMSSSPSPTNQPAPAVPNKPLRRRRANTPSKKSSSSWFGVGSRNVERRLMDVSGNTATTKSNNTRPKTVTSTTTTTSSICSFRWSSLSNFFHNHSSLEKVTIGILLLIAWGWIIVTIGMVLYHHQGYNPRPSPAAEASSPFASTNLHRENTQKEDDSLLLGQGASPLLIFTFRRADYLQTTLQYVLKFVPRNCDSVGCPIIVSQDGAMPDVTRVIQEFVPQFQAIGIPLIHWQHEQHDIQLRGSIARITHAQAYAALAQHYQWALNQVFSYPHQQSLPLLDELVAPQRVIVLEEDLQIAPDFFDYFAALAPMLERDTTLLAVSAYNDNGLQNKVANVTRLVRSDFFPGLGWMLTQNLWTHELSSHWPVAFWDDWLREPSQRQGRHVIRPEVSRTLHFGSQGGTSNNQFGQSLHDIHLNTVPVAWSDLDLTYLQLPQFNQDYWRLIQSAQTVSSLEAIHSRLDDDNNINNNINKHRNNDSVAVFRLEYHNQRPEFERLARSLGFFTDEKAGVPRTAYKGVVETRLGSAKGPLVLLTPPLSQLQLAFTTQSVAVNVD